MNDLYRNWVGSLAVPNFHFACHFFFVLTFHFYMYLPYTNTQFNGANLYETRSCYFQLNYKIFHKLAWHAVHMNLEGLSFVRIEFQYVTKLWRCDKFFSDSQSILFITAWTGPNNKNSIFINSSITLIDGNIHSLNIDDWIKLFFNFKLFWNAAICRAIENVVSIIIIHNTHTPNSL